MNKEYFDKHHSIPVHPLEEVNAKGLSVPDNIQVIKRNTHEAIHVLFKNEPPISQIVQLLEMNKGCLNEEFYKGMLNFIQMYANNWYKKECHRGMLIAEVRRILDIRT